MPIHIPKPEPVVGLEYRFPSGRHARVLSIVRAGITFRYCHPRGGWITSQEAGDLTVEREWLDKYATIQKAA